MARYWPHSDPGPAGAEHRPCARGPWCAEAVASADPDRPPVEPAWGPRMFCDTDARLIGSALTWSVRLHQALEAAIGERPAGERLTHVQPGPSIPIRGDVDALMRLLVEVAASWEERVREAAGLPPPGGDGRPREVLARAARLLARHLPALLALAPGPMQRPRPSARTIAEGSAPEVASVCGDRAVVILDGAWAGNELLGLDYAGRAALGLTPPKVEALLGVECRRCSQRALRRARPPARDGDPAWWSVCAGCGHRMERDEYDLWVGQLAAYHRARMRARPRLGGPPGRGLHPAAPAPRRARALFAARLRAV